MFFSALFSPSPEKRGNQQPHQKESQVIFGAYRCLLYFFKDYRDALNTIEQISKIQFTQRLVSMLTKSHDF